jgi:hypothetical protein
MTETRKRKEGKLKRPELSEPDVIVDFVFDDGLLFIAISNISDKPAYKVSVEFDEKIHGSGGKEIGALPLFKNIEFLAPHKEIVTFLDSSGSYFSGGGPTKLCARIAYQDFQGTKKLAMINHDLEIYREIGFIRRPKSDD